MYSNHANDKYCNLIGTNWLYNEPMKLFFLLYTLYKHLFFQRQNYDHLIESCLEY